MEMFQKKLGADKNATLAELMASFLRLIKCKTLVINKFKIKKSPPFIIGVNGSVASGKSFFAETLAEAFKPEDRVMVLSTDDFIYSNKFLKKMNLMDEKGWPSSYNWPLIFDTFEDIKARKSIKGLPKYNQNISNIDPKMTYAIPSDLDIIIIEGINALQPRVSKKYNRLLTDYMDFTVCIYAPEKFIYKWWFDRLKNKPKYKDRNLKELKQWAQKIWVDVNRPNIQKNITPMCVNRADLVITKNIDHSIKTLEFRL
jgi:type I pantothenate kinase